MPATKKPAVKKLPFSRAQTISRFGYNAVFSEPLTGKTNCTFDHAAERRSRSRG